MARVNLLTREKPGESQSKWVIGVLADTHVPDRTRQLDPRILSTFREARVGAILHAGDICVPRVLEALETIAPVYAVRGNRDLWALRRLPKFRLLEFGEVKVALVHGHGGLVTYLIDKLHFMRGRVLEIERFEQRALLMFPDVDVLVFGHVHLAINRWVGRRLLFNPGSACCPHRGQNAPSAGLISIHSRGRIEAEIIMLPGV